MEDAVAAARGADLVLCMSIHPGYSGQEFMPEALDRIRDLRSQLHERVVVQVDGGITRDNVRAGRTTRAPRRSSPARPIFGYEDTSRGLPAGSSARSLR